MKKDPPRRRLSASARRARIADAAMQVFAERGYHAASIDEIARSAGISKPVVYDHFASKADLHLRLLTEERDRLLALTMSAATLASAFEAFFTYVEDHPYAWRMLFRETTGDPDVAREHERILVQARVGIARQIARVAALRGRGSRLKSELLAEGVIGVTHGLALWWRAHPGVPRKDIVRAATDLLGPGLERLAAPLGAHVRGTRRRPIDHLSPLLVTMGSADERRSGVKPGPAVPTD